MLVQRSRYYVGWRTVILSVWVAALAALVWPRGAMHAAPSITIAPERVPCDGRLAVRGGGFSPGQAVAFVAFRPGGGNATPLGRAAAADNGAFAAEVEVRQIAGACNPAPGGETRYIINAVTDRGNGGGSFLATAAFIILSPASMPGLPNTGGGGLVAQPWPSTWGASLALLLAALGGAYAVRPRARRG